MFLNEDPFLPPYCLSPELLKIPINKHHWFLPSLPLEAMSICDKRLRVKKGEIVRGRKIIWVDLYVNEREEREIGCEILLPQFAFGYFGKQALFLFWWFMLMLMQNSPQFLNVAFLLRFVVVALVGVYPLLLTICNVIMVNP